MNTGVPIVKSPTASVWSIVPTPSESHSKGEQASTAGRVQAYTSAVAAVPEPSMWGSSRREKGRLPVWRKPLLALAVAVHWNEQIAPEPKVQPAVEPSLVQSGFAARAVPGSS